MCSIEEQVIRFVKLPRLHFLTLRGDGRAQKIGYVSDLVRKISKDYFIVREKDKKANCYHYHCIMSVLELPISKRWFRKGIHMHVVPIGVEQQLTPLGLVRHYNYPESQAEDEMNKYGPPGEMTELEMKLADEKFKYRAKCSAIRSKDKKTRNVRSVVCYMFKERPSLKYVDYI